ncbi:nucleotide exchange factor GrpE [Patescibacteria group bacterium]|nr:nucleotide exchange factor GrpE [Patescibacteria group bacterium]
MADDLSPQDVSSQVSDELAKIQAQSEEYLAGWKRAQADYANVLKERDRDRTEYVKYANTSLLQSLLPAIEHFATAMRHVPDTYSLPEDVRKKWDSWLIGLKAVQSLWEQAAQTAGLERIVGQGMLDPNIHEAVGREISHTVPQDHVVRVIQDGWKLHGKVLRPSQVIVSDVPTEEAISEA